MSIENIEPLSVKFINNDMVNNNKLPFDDVKYYQMFDKIMKTRQQQLGLDLD